MKRASSLIALALMLLTPSVVAANAPAPWWACDGKKVGDACSQAPYYSGYCELQPNCTPSGDTPNECLTCTGDKPSSDTSTPTTDTSTPTTDTSTPTTDTSTPTTDTTTPQGDTSGTIKGGGSSCTIAHTSTSLGLLLLLGLFAVGLRRRRKLSPNP